MPKKLLIIGFVWPEPNSSAAGSRMMQLIDAFKSQNYQITFATACAKSDNAFDLESYGITPLNIILNHSGFDDFIIKLQPDIVVFDRFMSEEQFGWRVAEHCPKALRILDTEDLHCLRKGRQQAFKDKAVFDQSYLYNETAKREIASIYRCDLSLIISEAEIEILKHQFKVDDALYTYLPFMLEELPLKTIEELPEFQSREHFISIGNFLHQPNYNSILYLKETIWPLIKQQLPKAELHVYGAYASQKVNQLHHKKDGFIIKGFAEDVNEVMQAAKVCLAPLRFGAGLKGKLVDAMQNGTPCAMTSIAAEGMFGTYDGNGFIEDNAEQFAKNAIQLYKDQKLWEEKQQNGFDLINLRFAKTTLQKKLIDTIETIKQELPTRRLQNFTGQMLQHHSMKSTTYMSKWIEEKNKKLKN